MFIKIVGVLLALLGAIVYAAWPADLGDYAFGFTVGSLAALFLTAALSIFAFSALAWGAGRATDPAPNAKTKSNA